MTKMAHGPSLPQAQASSSTTDTDSDSQRQRQPQQHNHHRHLHSHIRARHHHHHPPGDNDTPDTNHIRLHDKQQQQQEQPQQRDVADLESNLVTEVVQTVSVVQVVDGSGSPVEIKTYFPEESTVQTDGPDTGITAAGSPDSTETTAALPSSDDALPSETAAEQSTTAPTPSSDSSSLTSDPSSTFTSFPSLSGVLNSTAGPSFTNSTSFHSLFANKTATASLHSHTSFSFSISTASSESTLLTSITEVPTVTVFGNGDGTGIGAGIGAAGGIGATLTASSTGAPTDSSSGGGALDPATQGIVAGGVVGGVAGIALVVLAVIIAVKWKRRQGQRIQLLADGAAGSDNWRMSMFSRSGPGPDGAGGSRGSWVVPSALASLTGYKQQQASQTSIQSPETSERGFYRVSGRKLTSVLQSGGDGYGEPSESATDIRASTISGTSFYRPDSIAMFTDDPKRSPLQLGSPMRPESGIIIMRSGPGRTPIQEQGPIFDDTGPVTPLAPPPASAMVLPVEQPRDPLGRSLLNQSGSGVASSSGSPSRFTERMA